MKYRELIKGYMTTVYKITGKTCVYECPEFGNTEFISFDEEMQNELKSCELEVMEDIKKLNYKEEIHPDNLPIYNDAWRNAYYNNKKKFRA